MMLRFATLHRSMMPYHSFVYKNIFDTEMMVDCMSGAFSPRLKRKSREAYYSPPTSAQVKET
jgi:hypothetical protein